jgi:hypothetical protein
MQRSGWAAALGAWVCVAGWLGCNAIAGIQEGILAPSDGGIDGADVTTGDTGGGNDSGGGDTTTMTDGGPDAMAEAEAGPLLAACNLVPNSTVLVDDLSTHDGGDLQFGNGLGITSLKNVNGEAIVVVQTQSENNDIRGYRVSYGQGAQGPSYLSGVATKGGIQIQDTISDPNGNGNVVLTSYETSFFTQPDYGLQLIPLPNDNNELFSSGGYELVDFGLQSVGEAHAMQLSSTGAIWTATTVGESFARSYITVGAGFSDDAGAANQNLVTISGTTPNWSLNIPPFVVGSSVYVIANQFTDAGGAGVFSAAADLSDGGPLGSIGAKGMSTVFAAHGSVGSPGKVLVVAGALNNQAMLGIYSATVDPSVLGTLTIGQAPFTGGASVSLGDMPFDRGSGPIWTDDELFAVGTPGDKSVGGVLAWIGPDGHLVSGASTSGGKLIQTNNAIQKCAIAAQDHIGESHADLVVTWIERMHPEGGAMPYDVLYSAQVVCNPYMPGGG